LLDAGEIQGAKVGRQWRFRPAELDAYLGRGTAPLPDAPTTELQQAEPALRRFSEEGGVTLPVGGDLLSWLAEEMLRQAVIRNASDLHLGLDAGESRLRYRQDGLLHQALRLPAALHEPLVARLKLAAGMAPAERRVPKDGRFSRRVEEREFLFFLNSAPALHGENVVIRVSPRTGLLLPLDRLGLLEEDERELRRLLALPNGLILVSGPNNSGVTTTLYSGLQALAREGSNLLSVEEPVEHELPGVVQFGAAARTGLRFPELLRSLFRQDPDVVMIGEVADAETAELSVQFALTGHLVLAGTHARNAVEAVAWLTGLGAPRFLLSTTLAGVLSQRLARRLCVECRRPAVGASPALTYLRELAGESDSGLPGQEQVAVGCEACRNRGYRERIGLFELLIPGNEFREAVRRESTEAELLSAARKDGLRSLAMDGLRKVLAGETTAEEVLRALTP
jgi:type II secretory ATPase GspE/PulE/Tfp pilus assembly ATPase PilB-like protein